LILLISLLFVFHRFRHTDSTTISNTTPTILKEGTRRLISLGSKWRKICKKDSNPYPSKGLHN